MTKRIVILAQFDPENRLQSHVRLHLEGLRPAADRLVLVSNSPLENGSLEVAEAICDRVLVRENTGWDFAGWRDVLATEEVGAFERVILTNSSVIGPFFPLLPIFEKMEARTEDIWGMVLTKNKGIHLQSYFLSVSAKVVASKAWREFWASVENIDDKWQVIKKYEIGFSQAMRDGGFELLSLVEPLRPPHNIRLVNVERLKGRVRIPFDVNRINRTVEFHKELIAQGMPYLKASLIYGKDTYRFVGFDKIKEAADIQFPLDRLDR